MFTCKTKVALFVVIVVTYLSGTGSTIAPAQQAKKAFTVADEIGLTLFGGGRPEGHFSLDGNYFAVWSERGRLDINSVVDSLRFYRSKDVKDFLEDSDESRPPSPVWVVDRSGMVGENISNWRWLEDSSGVAFLERAASGNQRLVLADLRKKTVEPMTSVTEAVTGFDVRDRDHYVYTVADPAPLQKMRDERQAPAIVGTGRDLYELLFPDDALTVRIVSNRSYLWAVLAGKRFQIKHNGTPLVLFGGGLVLSPDGASLVTTVPVPDVPASWETLYPPPFASYSYRIHAGHQDVQSGGRLTKQYVRIDLQTGSLVSLTGAPTSNDAGWWAGGSPSWSSDAQEIVLPGTFIQSKDNAPSRPCVAVVDLSSGTCTCVEMLKGVTETGYEEGYRSIQVTRFLNGEKQRVTVAFIDHQDHSYRTTEYRRTTAGTWQVAGESKGEPKVEHSGLEVTVKQWFNEPPLIVARSKQTSRVIWDPNPQLKNLDLGQASVYTWKDKEGRELRGGLFKPSDYKPGRRYPLVIQTHGFAESEFRPSGVFPTGMAARALAAAGIIVLQTEKVGECTDSDTPDEGPCKASGLEAVAKRLVSEGMVDPERIGIIGFSATCFPVMEALTTKSFLKAASITDGAMGDYFQYTIAVAMKNGDAFTNIYNSRVGAAPFGEGLQQWLKRSPGFNLDKINAPLMVVGLGPWSLLTMLKPYAGLHYLHKPVDLIMLNTHEHVLTNPAVRMASQGGAVDWFCFWLKGEEDPNPAKVEQYARWHELRKMQADNNDKLMKSRAVLK